MTLNKLFILHWEAVVVVIVL